MMLVETEDRKSETALGMLIHDSRARLFNDLRLADIDRVISTIQYLLM